MEKESDYIKRSIEFHKYLFSSSAALLLIIVWKILTEYDNISKIKDSLLSNILIIGFTFGLTILCYDSLRKWSMRVEELK